MSTHGGYSVYIIYNFLREKHYVGFTSDLSNRLLRHNRILPSKKSSFTYKHSGKWELIYKEEYFSITETKKRERWFKSGFGREFIKKNIKLWIKNSPACRQVNGRSAVGGLLS